MEAIAFLAAIVASLVAFGVAADRFGVDSRDGFGAGSNRTSALAGHAGQGRRSLVP